MEDFARMRRGHGVRGRDKNLEDFGDRQRLVHIDEMLSERHTAQPFHDTKNEAKLLPSRRGSAWR